MNIWFYIAIGFFLFQLVQNLVLLVAYKEWRKSNERLDKAYKDNIDLLKAKNLNLLGRILNLKEQFKQKQP